MVINMKAVKNSKQQDIPVVHSRKFLGMCIVGGVLICIIIGVLFYAYQEQYNNNRVGRYINITINQEVGKEYVGESEGYLVYTIQLEEPYLIDFFAKKISLKQALSDKLISLNDMIEYMEKTLDEDGVVEYTFENYKMHFENGSCVIMPLEETGDKK